MNISKIFIRHGRCHQKRNMDSQRGVAMVEFAIVLPLLLILMFGLIEFGLVLYNKQVITNASREGARYGISSEDGIRISENKIRNIIIDYVDTHMITFGTDEIGDELGDIIITPNPQTETTKNNYYDTYKNLICTVNYEYGFIAAGLLLSDINLSATTVMKFEKIPES
ncbi:TadE/TadG family type IV pilus assembly protein [Desulfovermiculus halophilus]|jgi:Flp pilus assembly protein TadG|uniref:TadE/TadG family type IV pilus assembly protein n=1 Tax=Desulfovermiculus halophilus TaxID=339722 RepID=UPI0006844E19|nr:TadE/TadG family type IV pilus assembly protein [Desulfovermiculus halophilus]